MLRFDISFGLVVSFTAGSLYPSSSLAIIYRGPVYLFFIFCHVSNLTFCTDTVHLFQLGCTSKWKNLGFDEAYLGGSIVLFDMFVEIKWMRE